MNQKKIYILIHVWLTQIIVSSLYSPVELQEKKMETNCIHEQHHQLVALLFSFQTVPAPPMLTFIVNNIFHQLYISHESPTDFSSFFFLSFFFFILFVRNILSSFKVWGIECFCLFVCFRFLYFDFLFFCYVLLYM